MPSDDAPAPPSPCVIVDADTEEPADDATQSNSEEKTPPGNETEVKETPKEGENTPE